MPSLLQLPVSFLDSIRINEVSQKSTAHIKWDIVRVIHVCPPLPPGACQPMMSLGKAENRSSNNVYSQKSSAYFTTIQSKQRGITPINYPVVKLTFLHIMSTCDITIRTCYISQSLHNKEIYPYCSYILYLQHNHVHMQVCLQYLANNENTKIE